MDKVSVDRKVAGLKAELAKLTEKYRRELLGEEERLELLETIVWLRRRCEREDG